MSAKITIIGAGIVGICSALALTERGFKVHLIDRDPPASGASYGNAGVISPWSCVPQSLPGLWKQVPQWLLDPKGPVSVKFTHLARFAPWVLQFLKAGRPDRIPAIADAMHALNRPNLSLYRGLLEGTGEESLVVDSYYVYVYRQAADADPNSLTWKMRAEKQVPFDVVQGAELRALEPALSPDIQAAIVIRDQGRAMSPGAVGEALFKKATERGVSYEQRSVRAIKADSDGQWVIDTESGSVHTPLCLIAAGAWSARLLSTVNVRVPIEAERGYHLVLQQPGITLNNSIMDTDRKFVASSMAAGVRCAGTAEFAGLDTAPNYQRARVFKTLAKELFPDIKTDDTVEWMGTRPSLPDSLPVIGPVAEYPGLFVAFGHSHFGFGMAPNTGKTIAQVIAGETPTIDIHPYRVNRFY